MSKESTSFEVWPGAENTAEEKSLVSGLGSSNAVLPAILPTPLEQKIFQRLLGTIEHFKLTVEVRVAGGWVRDKLLGKESDDIDLAVDTMMGEEFADKVNGYLSHLGEDFNRVAVIQKNPEQSKHLETATFRLCGESIDCNNLRTEVYHGGSRIPTMQRATAEEDATRRDFTINSMFYNIRTMQVEDLCQKGISDLKEGLIRTPLPPENTFLDDPLRVLRAARFAGKLGYDVVDEITKAASSVEVQDALLQKVSRERYGLEVNKMANCKHPKSCVYAFRLLCEWGLRAVVFQFPPKPMELEPAARQTISSSLLARTNALALEEQKSGLEEMQLTEAMLDCLTTSIDIVCKRKRVLPNSRVFVYAAFLFPMFGLRYEFKKQRFLSVVHYVLRESLKLPMKYGTTCVNFIEGALAFQSIIAQWKRARGCDEEVKIKLFENIQLDSGNTLRTLGEEWRCAFYLAEAISCVGRTEGGDKDTEEGEEKEGAGSQGDYDEYDSWLLNQSGLFGGGTNGGLATLGPVWKWKPLLNGKQIGKEFGAKGKEVGELMRKQMELMISKPGLTSDTDKFHEAFALIASPKLSKMD